MKTSVTVYKSTQVYFLQGREFSFRSRCLVKGVSGTSGYLLRYSLLVFAIWFLRQFFLCLNRNDEKLQSRKRIVCTGILNRTLFLYAINFASYCHRILSSTRGCIAVSEVVTWLVVCSAVDGVSSLSVLPYVCLWHDSGAAGQIFT
jgi:hypothetical protein